MVRKQQTGAGILQNVLLEHRFWQDRDINPGMFFTLSYRFPPKKKRSPKPQKRSLARVSPGVDSGGTVFPYALLSPDLLPVNILGSRY